MIKLPKFICYNLFPAFCQQQLDLDTRTIGIDVLYPIKRFNVAEIKENDLIFVKTDFLQKFIDEIFPTITKRFRLVTGVSDLSPTMEQCKFLLSSEKILNWYGCNLPFHSPKSFCLPIGFPEQERVTGNQNFLHEFFEKKFTPKEKSDKIYIPSFGETHPYRVLAKSFIIKNRRKLKKNYEIEENQLPYREYLQKLSSFKYCICVRGGGIDVHRVYECILTETIPIYISNTKSPEIYAHLPIIIIPKLKKLFDIDWIKNQVKISQVNWENVKKYLLTDYYRSIFNK